MKRYKLKPTAAIHYAIDYEKHLNPEQLAVVMAERGPLLVIAGAGSGKTRTLTYRVARLIESGTDPSRILLLTFTNKAAREMLHRVELLIKQDIKKIWGGTFHHVANLMLRRHAKLLGYRDSYTILDREDAKDLLDSCVEEIGIDITARRFPKGNVLLEIKSLAVNTPKPLAVILQDRVPFFGELLPDIEKVLSRYGEKKRKNQLMDYDDLLVNALVLLRQFPEVRDSYTHRFLHILVDEYQDTNKIQADFVDLLAAYHRNLMVVGDDCQSIYSFRGANFANIMNFPERYPDVQLFRLETNYRSTPEILSLANSSIRYNQRQYQKTLRAISRPGPKPVLVALNDISQQAAFIAQHLLELRDEGLALDDICVLYRSHYQSMELQMELMRRGIPFKLISGLRFFEQRHVKDVLAIMRIVVNPTDELAWKRAVKLLPKTGNVTANRIWNALSSANQPLQFALSSAAEPLVPPAARIFWKTFTKLLQMLSEPAILRDPATMIQMILTEGGYQEYLETHFENPEMRAEDLHQLANYASQFANAQQFLSDLALLGTVEAQDIVMGGPEDEKVHLSTLHQAKGLEWRAVFLIWLAEGGFPAPRALREPGGEEEERRLFYVGVTRAKDQLYLTYPLMVRTTIHKPSRFVQELDSVTYEAWAIAESEEGE